jgi:hypothetical protein
LDAGTGFSFARLAWMRGSSTWLKFWLFVGWIVFLSSSR